MTPEVDRIWEIAKATNHVCDAISMAFYFLAAGLGFYMGRMVGRSERGAIEAEKKG